MASAYETTKDYLCTVKKSALNLKPFGREHSRLQDWEEKRKENVPSILPPTSFAITAASVQFSNSCLVSKYSPIGISVYILIAPAPAPSDLMWEGIVRVVKMSQKGVWIWTRSIIKIVVWNPQFLFNLSEILG